MTEPLGEPPAPDTEPTAPVGALPELEARADGEPPAEPGPSAEAALPLDPEAEPDDEHGAEPENEPLLEPETVPPTTIARRLRRLPALLGAAILVAAGVFLALVGVLRVVAPGPAIAQPSPGPSPTASTPAVVLPTVG